MCLAQNVFPSTWSFVVVISVLYSRGSAYSTHYTVTLMHISTCKSLQDRPQAFAQTSVAIGYNSVCITEFRVCTNRFEIRHSDAFCISGDLLFVDEESFWLNHRFWQTYSIFCIIRVSLVSSQSARQSVLDYWNKENSTSTEIRIKKIIRIRREENIMWSFQRIWIELAKNGDVGVR